MLLACSPQNDPLGPAAAAETAPATSGSGDSASEVTAGGPVVNGIPAVLRVGGDMDASVERRGESFYSGACSITTPLPDGYPSPTPPGAIDIKAYPSVRRAEVSGDSSPDFGMNLGFWPLFNHIKDRGIAMTSPVEMDYRGGDEDSVGRAWTMSFLYRTDELGPTGQAGRVKVVDTAPMAVLALGGQGSYSRTRVQDGLETLRLWLDANPQWRAAGEPRALYYNGPDVPNRNKWYEVQIPIRRVGAEG